MERFSYRRRKPPKRSGQAEQLKKLRLYEARSNPIQIYEMNRTPEQYAKCLDGYLSSLQYARELNSSNIVLDIGAGTTNAIAQIAQSEEAYGLEFEATVIRYDSSITDNLGFKNKSGKKITHVTPVEALRGVRDKSVALALSVYSVTYSSDPTRAVDGIDRVLADGGIFKGVFNPISGLARIDIYSFDHIPFMERFKILGYDVANCGEILLAKKPGGNIGIRAFHLLGSDAASH